MVRGREGRGREGRGRDGEEPAIHTWSESGFKTVYMLRSLTISSALPLNGIFCSCLMPGEICT